MRNNRNDQSCMDRAHRETLASSLSSLIRKIIDRDRKVPYYLNFMFNHIPGGSERKLQVMQAEVTRVHDILTRHIVRRRDAFSWRRFRPIFIGCPDLPVIKNKKKELLRDLIVNDGWHFNVIALVPPPAEADVPEEFRLLYAQQSRLDVPLDAHFCSKSHFYLNETLARIHVTPVIKGTMADYTFKNFKHGRVDWDSVLVLR